MQWGEYGYRVVSTAAVTPVIRELWFEPVAAPLEYRPGQYALLSDTTYAVPQRSYSIANAPRVDGKVSMLVTLVRGGPTSTWAHGLAAGDGVTLEGPFGTLMTTPTATAPLLLLGAGSGLAPMRALAEAALDGSGRFCAPGREVTLHFSGRTEADVIDRARFADWADRYPQFRYEVTLTRPGGVRAPRVPELLRRSGANLTGTEVFVAGPPGFVSGCQAAALALGAATVDIHTEEFFADPAPWHDVMPPVPGPELYQEAP